MRGQQHLQGNAGWDQFIEEYRETCRRQRDLVLRHPHIAVRLTQRPLSYATPEQWTGYVPPYQWNGSINDSSRRAALIDIITAAEKATKEAS